ncbi:hypothetical protein O181_039083 [Austropuccinia psidii MF-1]|uniref:Chromo domain-containing protein n=1 Tax=Austropuccinia psidii MF-1 TaxID=1389203 RepID=A0A9Q3DCP2_9BASI|nr:hypothetical protein [Austropuccinia psidii MF-1]
MVFSSSEEEHVKHVTSVLQRLRDNNLFSKASNSANPQLASAKEHQGSSILSWLCHFLSTFHQKLLQKIISLTSLLKKDSPFIFNEEALSQFQILKEEFTTAPILSHLNPSLPAILKTDASDYDLGAVVSQVNDSGKHPIAFDNCPLLPAELNYEINDKELLGIAWALKRWRAFLLPLSDSFEVLTAHSSLQYFMSPKVLTCRQALWSEFLLEFHFTITYLPGRLATLPDALSRWYNVYPEREVDLISKNPQRFHQVIKQDGIGESRFFSIKVEIFSNLVDKIQKERHDSPLAGHPAQEKTLKPIKRDLYCAGINQLIKYYVSSFIKKIGIHVYHLQLPQQWKSVHPVFHVSSLEPVKKSRIPNCHQLPPPPVLVEEEEEWELAQVLDSKLKRSKLWYHVEWKGFSEDLERTTWEPAFNLTNSPDLVKDFHSLYPDKAGPNTSRI